MKVKVILPLVFVALLLFASFAVVPTTEVGAEPTRTNPLYQLTESYNWSFSKPTFYGTTDPNNNNAQVEANDWDDIAIMVVLQDKHKTKVYENANPSGNQVDCADIYQTIFVPLNGTLMESGTDQTVIVEDFTATWCIYCTGVVGAMNRLDLDDSWFPEKYIGIEWHSGGGTYGTGTALSAATARKNEYGLAGGIPRYVTDGMLPYVGGSASANATAIDTRIQGDINTRGASASPITISATGSHDSSKAYVEFDIEVVDQNFDNALVEAYAFLVQDAYPRRHGANADAYLGWIGQDSKSQRVLNVASNVPVISDVTPAADSVLSGDVTIDFSVTDPDSDDAKISNHVYVKEASAADWDKINPIGGNYLWKTAEKLGPNYIYEDGDYQIKIYSQDYWWDEAEYIFDVSVKNPDPPMVNLKEEDMISQISLEGEVRGTFEILWNMNDDEDDTGLSADIMYKSASTIEWTPIAEDLVDVTSYAWDTLDPRMPDDENYKIMVIITDTDGMTAEVEGSDDLRFEINNPDPPVLEVNYPPEGKELAETATIRWTATDDEDSQQMLKADIYLSSDSGTTFTKIGDNRPNSGSFSFDTLSYDDGTGYMGKIVIRDTEGYEVEGLTNVFSIYNNDRPDVSFITPAQDDTVTGEVEITWTSSDQEDAEGELLYDLHYMSEADTYWKPITLDEVNTGSYTWDTSRLTEGDGVYTIKIVIRDSRNLESDTMQRYFTVYNPDAPFISNPVGPTDSVESITTLSWVASDPDPFETDQLKVWLYYRSGDGEWLGIDDAQGITNINQHQVDVSGWEDGTYSVKLLVSDGQEGVNERSVEHIFMNVVVDNNDPPAVAFTSIPEPESNNTGDISLSWEGSDPENKGITYALYYRPAGEDGWIPVPGATKLMTTSFVWDTAEIDTGDYEIKIVAEDGSREKLTQEEMGAVFSIYTPVIVEPDDDDDDDETPIAPADDGDDGSSSGIILIILIFGVLLFVILIVAGLLVIKRKNASQQVPPPGGLPPQNAPAISPAQQPGLQGTVDSGALPPTTAPAQQLPAAAEQPPAAPPAV